MNETAVMGEDKGQRGQQRPVLNGNHSMSTGTGPGSAVTVSD